jgi:hypothetical protein
MAVTFTEQEAETAHEDNRLQSTKVTDANRCGEMANY